MSLGTYIVACKREKAYRIIVDLTEQGKVQFLTCDYWHTKTTSRGLPLHVANKDLKLGNCKYTHTHTLWA